MRQHQAEQHRALARAEHDAADEAEVDRVLPQHVERADEGHAEEQRQRGHQRVVRPHLRGERRAPGGRSSSRRSRGRRACAPAVGRAPGRGSARGGRAARASSPPTRRGWPPRRPPTSATCGRPSPGSRRARPRASAAQPRHRRRAHGRGPRPATSSRDSRAVSAGSGARDCTSARCVGRLPVERHQLVGLGRASSRRRPARSSSRRHCPSCAATKASRSPKALIARSRDAAAPGRRGRPSVRSCPAGRAGGSTLGGCSRPRTALVSGEGVRLELGTAGVGSRMLAAVIDVAVQVGPPCWCSCCSPAWSPRRDGAAVAAVVIIEIGAGARRLPDRRRVARPAGARSARSCLGLRVVRDDGGPIGFRQALVRGLAGLVLEKPGLLAPLTTVGRGDHVGARARGTSASAT